MELFARSREQTILLGLDPLVSHRKRALTARSRGSGTSNRYASVVAGVDL
jgi:hypothetical protein